MVRGRACAAWIVAATALGGCDGSGTRARADGAADAGLHCVLSSARVCSATGAPECTWMDPPNDWAEAEAGSCRSADGRLWQCDAFRVLERFGTDLAFVAFYDAAGKLAGRLFQSYDGRVTCDAYAASFVLPSTGAPPGPLTAHLQDCTALDAVCPADAGADRAAPP